METNIDTLDTYENNSNFLSQRKKIVLLKYKKVTLSLVSPIKGWKENCKLRER